MWKYEVYKIMYETEKLSQALWFIFSDYQTTNETILSISFSF